MRGDGSAPVVRPCIAEAALAGLYSGGGSNEISSVHERYALTGAGREVERLRPSHPTKKSPKRDLEVGGPRLAIANPRRPRVLRSSPGRRAYF